MADSGTVVVWSRVPVGSKFKLTATGNQNVFDVGARVTLNGEKKPDLTHDQIMAGASIDIDGVGQRWIVRPELVLSEDNDEDIVLEAIVVDENGNPVNVPDGEGGQRPATATWEIRKVADSPLEIRISIRSVVS